MINPDAILIYDSVESAEGLMFDGYDTTKKPYFKTAEVAKFFFCRGSRWLRMLMIEPYVRELHVAKDERGYYEFTLADIERIAYALFENGVINVRRLRLILGTLRMQGLLYDILPGEITLPKV